MTTLKEKFEKLREKQDLSNLFYPEAKDWMWNYCLFLGKFTDSKGINYDLGVHFNGNPYANYFSLAIVFSNNPGDYLSGDMDLEGLKNHEWEHVVQTNVLLKKFLYETHKNR